MDDALVVICFTEGPNSLFVNTMINKWLVGIGRVCEQVLTLSVSRDEFLVSVCSRNKGRGAHNTFFLWHERLQTLEVVCLEHIDIINVMVVVTVILDALVETSEGVIEHMLVKLLVD